MIFAKDNFHRVQPLILSNLPGDIGYKGYQGQLPGSFNCLGKLTLVLITIPGSPARNYFALFGQEANQTLLISEIYK
jgi:hypothetical protein